METILTFTSATDGFCWILREVRLPFVQSVYFTIQRNMNTASTKHGVCFVLHCAKCFITCKVLCHLQYITCNTLPVTHHLQHFTYNISLAIHRLQYIIYKTSLAIHHLHIYHLQHINCSTSPAIHHLQHITGNTSL